MSVKSKNGRLAARVLVALAALFAMIALTGSACLAEGPRLAATLRGTGSGGWHCDRRADAQRRLTAPFGICTHFHPTARLFVSASDESVPSRLRKDRRDAAEFRGAAPEVNSARVFAGAGSAPMLAAAAAWDDLASELHCAAMSFGSVTSGLVVGWWQGSASAAMVDAAASYIGWLSTSAAHAEGAAGLARAAVSVFEEALAATVHPAMVAANRAQVASLVASNLFGQNAPAIAALESLYECMWAQDAAAMAGYYVGASAVATQLASWLQRLQSIPGAASLDARLPSSAEAPMGVVRAVNSAIAANAAAAQTVGLVMGGSGTPIPSARYVELANALYMSGSVPGVIAQALFTPQGLYPVVVIKNLTFDSSVAQGAVILESAIRQQIAAGNNVTVFGYSQSATISSLVMANLAASADPPSQTSFPSR